MLIQLTYSSRATSSLDSKDLRSLIATAQVNNVNRGITGALCYASGTFLQCLEGERLAVNQLYLHLAKDKRHDEMEISSMSEISERRFPNWTMGFFSYENDIGQLFLKHSRMAEFSPFSMNASDVNKFFDEVVKYNSLTK